MEHQLTESMWEVALKGVLAYQKTMCGVDEGRRRFRDECPIAPAPSIVERKPKEIREKNCVVPKQKRGKPFLTRIPSPPSMREKVKRNPLVGSLRGKLIPWVFGTQDEWFEEIIGTTAQEFRQYISSQFSAGMNWANHGYWHLDHILPVASFNHDDPEQVKKCWHFTNFQPLWGRHNSQKGAKLNYGKNTDGTNAGVASEEPRQVSRVPEGTDAQEAGIKNF